MKPLLSLLVTLLVLTSTTLASAAARTWVGPVCASGCPLGGDWAVASNWSPAGVPGAGDTATVPGNGVVGTFMVVTNASGSVGGLTMSGNASLGDRRHAGEQRRDSAFTNTGTFTVWV